MTNRYKVISNGHVRGTDSKPHLFQIVEQELKMALPYIKGGLTVIIKEAPTEEDIKVLTLTQMLGEATKNLNKLSDEIAFLKRKIEIKEGRT